ncbi:MAG: helix-turn-helix domain-containing protein [Candidatus Gracilibacteria bacterium]
MIDKSKILKTLLDIGFSEKEAKIYLVVLELNEALPGVISRISKVKRSSTYLILQGLQEKGLLSNIKKNGHLYFRAVDPSNFVNLELEKNEIIKDSLKDLKGSLPELLSLYQDYANIPQMSVFRGKAGLIQIMEDTLTAKGELLCWSNADLAVNTLLRDYHPSYLAKKIKRGVWNKCLFLDDETGLKFKKRSKQELREVHLIPKEYFYFENEINVYDDKVSIISHKDNLGVIIQNEAIANTQRAIFNFAFAYAKILERGFPTKENLTCSDAMNIDDQKA